MNSNKPNSNNPNSSNPTRVPELTLSLEQKKETKNQ
jgi:hypothetical protein